MRITLLALVLVLASLASAASHVLVTEPVQREIVAGSDVVDLGTVGPGQKVEIVVERGTGELHAVTQKETLWDKVSVVSSSLPAGWEGVDSLSYETPMKAFVIIDKNAPDGEYVFSLNAFDELEGTPTQEFKARVIVSRDVLEFEPVTPSVVAGGGQPAIYTFRVANKGSASDVFEISVESGLPQRWTFVKQVFVTKNSEVNAQYEIVSEGYGKFPVVFKAVSLSSSEISRMAQAELVAESSLFLEAKAASHGILLFPSVEQAVYSLIGFLANLAGYFVS